jgi:hypothetical protein
MGEGNTPIQKYITIYYHRYIIYHISLFPSGWWYTYPSEKYKFVSWDHEIPNINMESQSKFHGSSHHQPAMFYQLLLTIINHN